MLVKANLAKLALTKPPPVLTSILPRFLSQEQPGLSEERKEVIKRRNYRFGYPEFLPDCERKHRNHTRELLERKDMLARRENTMIPEFYVGSIVAVTVANPPANGPEKEARFVGIVIDRGGTGLRAWMIVRNVIDGLGVEFMYDLYSPTVKEIEVLRLEKRIDDELYYLRDCDPKYSTFPMNMTAELLPQGQPVPVNETVVPLGPLPWRKKWQRYDDRLFGFSYDPKIFTYKQSKEMSNFRSRLSQGWQFQFFKYDLMRDYFLTIPMEEQDHIWKEVAPALERREAMMKRIAAKKAITSSSQKS